jgi:hypothetical protein
MLLPKVVATNARDAFAKIFHNPLGAQEISRKSAAAFDRIMLNQKG